MYAGHYDNVGDRMHQQLFDTSRVVHASNPVLVSNVNEGVNQTEENVSIGNRGPSLRLDTDDKDESGEYDRMKAGSGDDDTFAPMSNDRNRDGDAPDSLDRLMGREDVDHSNHTFDFASSTIHDNDPTNDQQDDAVGSGSGSGSASNTCQSSAASSPAHHSRFGSDLSFLHLSPSSINMNMNGRVPSRDLDPNAGIGGDLDMHISPAHLHRMGIVMDQYQGEDRYQDQDFMPATFDPTRSPSPSPHPNPHHHHHHPQPDDDDEQQPHRSNDLQLGVRHDRMLQTSPAGAE